MNVTDTIRAKRAEVAPYAEAYAKHVRLLRDAQKALDDAEIELGENDVTVEVTIDSGVYDTAMLRSQRDGVALAALGRGLLFQAALAAEPDPEFDPTVNRPQLRRHVKTPWRWRFTAPREAHEAARYLIEASRHTISAVIEDGLRRYALTGKI